MFEGSFDPARDPKRSHHVGMSKYELREHDFSHWFFDDRIQPKDPRSVRHAPGLPPGKIPTFSLQEPEKTLNQPAFNVLMVRTEKPRILRVPIVRGFLETWAEAMDLLKPVFRFGVRETSLKDKCKWWR